MARLIVAAGLIVVVVAILLVAAGLLRVEDSPEQTTITLDKAQLRDTSREALEKTEDADRRLLEGADEGVRSVGKDLKDALGDDSGEPKRGEQRAADQRGGTAPPEELRR